MGMSSSGESLRKALCRTRSNVVSAETNLNYGGQQQQQYSFNNKSHCQQQLQLPRQTGMCGNRLPGWPPSDEPQQGFPKSHSVENLTPSFSMPSSPSQQQLGAASNNYGQQQQQQNSMWLPGSVSPSEDVDGVNLHRKLQRQLTLNPGGCDPRIYQIQRGMCGMPQQQQQGGASGNSAGPPHSPHRPLEPSRSSHCGGASPWDMQQQQQQQQHHHHAQHQVIKRLHFSEKR